MTPYTEGINADTFNEYADAKNALKEWDQKRLDRISPRAVKYAGLTKSVVVQAFHEIYPSYATKEAEFYVALFNDKGREIIRVVFK